MPFLEVKCRMGEIVEGVVDAEFGGEVEPYSGFGEGVDEAVFECVATRADAVDGRVFSDGDEEANHAHRRKAF